MRAQRPFNVSPSSCEDFLASCDSNISQARPVFSLPLTGNQPFHQGAVVLFKGEGYLKAKLWPAAFVALGLPLLPSLPVDRTKKCTYLHTHSYTHTHAYVGWQNTPPPNMPLWHADYFEQKAFKNGRCKKGALTSLFLPENRRGNSSVKDALPLSGGRPFHCQTRASRLSKFHTNGPWENDSYLPLASHIF